MKKSILLPLLLISGSLFAQQTHLPEKVKIELTDKQVVALSMKIDSVNQLLINSNYPSGTINAFVGRLQKDFEPLWLEVRKQMVKDSVKVERRKP